MAWVSGLMDTQTTIDSSLIDINQSMSASNTMVRSMVTVVTSSFSLFTQARVVTTSGTGSASGYYRPIT